MSIFDMKGVAVLVMTFAGMMLFGMVGQNSKLPCIAIAHATKIPPPAQNQYIQENILGSAQRAAFQRAPVEKRNSSKTLVKFRKFMWFSSKILVKFRKFK